MPVSGNRVGGSWQILKLLVTTIWKSEAIPREHMHFGVPLQGRTISRECVGKWKYHQHKGDRFREEGWLAVRTDFSRRAKGDAGERGGGGFGVQGQG